MNILMIATVAANLWSGFVNPPTSVRPWCYHWWVNGNVDRETITADLEDMKALGFGGVNMIDSRGYWDNSIDHVKVPPVDIQWGTEKWYDMVEHEIRECARLGLEFTMNAACSGGTLSRQIDGKIVETDVTRKDEVRKHLDAAIGPLLRRCPELIGKTFTHLYSVSYEGNKAGGSWKKVKDTFYAAMVEWAHEHGLKVYSESGGPWEWGSKTAKLDCSQIDMLAVNDFPQGEFWPNGSYGNESVRHANANIRLFMRGIVLAARREGRRIVSAEAFTHMLHHYSVDPSVLKPLADIAFADGVNRLVWHTYTCSPKRFGVPGAEYFAGSHINRHVTWHDDASAFVGYLGRCQFLLQSGEPVDDGEFLEEERQYYGWGRFRKDERAQFTTTHRRIGGTDVFFVAGEGRGEIKLNAPLDGRSAEIWDAVTATRSAASVRDGKIQLDLPVGGSAFIVIGEKSEPSAPPPALVGAKRIDGPWSVSFAYRPGVAATPPADRTFTELGEWTEVADLKNFAGTATYRTTFEFGGSKRTVVSVGELPSGTARVLVNGVDCGVAWCAPFEVDVTKAAKKGVNSLEIRYSNNWHNRLVADAALPESQRVTKSMFRYWDKPRSVQKQQWWGAKPTVWSGPSVSDVPQRSGLLGPVEIKYAEPGFTMRIDDNKSVKDWRRLADLFEKRGIFVSFAVVPATLTEEQGACLRELSQRGHLLMDHTPNHNFYVITYKDRSMYESAKKLPDVHETFDGHMKVWFKPTVNRAFEKNWRATGSIRNGVLSLDDPKRKISRYGSFFSVPDRPEVFGIKFAKDGSMQVVDFWCRPLKEPLNLDNGEILFYDELALQPSDDVLRELAKVSRERFDHFRLPRPTIWVRPGGWCPGIDQDRIGRIYGGEFGYVGADSRPGKLAWGKGRWCTGYDQMYFFDQGAKITPEKLVSDIERELKSGRYHVRLSHMWSHQLPGGVEEWYSKAERFADLVRERGIRMITMLQQYEERFGK